MLAALAAGGMGEVYKARDTRLGRTVAIKVLSGEFAADPDRRARFEREARAIAALSHPHICVLHDVGRDRPAGAGDPLDYLVMECLEGETLAERLTRTGALPLAEVVGIASQIADALQVAHRAGIVHRDLKPANIMLTKRGAPSGSVPQAKLLDFGLAKDRVSAVSLSSSHLTTMPGDTARGTLLGTVHYMSPEQVEGQEADARSDIWALGVVIYEMATGTRPFDGTTPASIIGAILKDSPPAVSARRPLLLVTLDRCVTRCLEKDPDARWQSAADLRSTLQWALDGSTIAPASLPALSHRRRVVPAALVAALAAALLVAVGVWIGRKLLVAPATPASIVQFDIQPPLDVALSPAPVGGTPQIALSPDGRQIAFVGMKRRSASQIYVRSLDDRDARLLESTDGASFPFWSPDSKSLAFFAGGKLKKISIAGGVAQTVADAPAGRGGSWGEDGTIIFSATPNEGIRRVPSVGGDSSPVTTVVRGQPGPDRSDEQVIGHNWAQFMPDGRRFVYYQRAGDPAHQGIYVGELGTSFRSPIVLPVNGLALQSSGQLLWVRDGVLLAQRLDEQTLRLTGEPNRIADRIGYFSGSFGYSAITVSRAGLLAYGPPIGTVSSLQWYSRTGTVTGHLGGQGIYVSPRLSRDEQKVTVAKVGDTMTERDLWTFDISRNTASRVTFDNGADWFPALAPDGLRIFFGSTRTGITSVFEKMGVGPEKSLLFLPYATYPSDVSSDGQLLAHVQSTERGYDLGVMTLDGQAQSTPFLSTAFNEVQAQFAPNMRWIAYASDESGQFEIYVRPYPSGNTQTKVSLAGGMQPTWRRDGKELFYIARDGKMMAVSVSIQGPTLDAGTPQALFEVETPEAIAPYPTHYAVTADGQRFLVNVVVDQPTRPAITVIMNWTAALPK